MGHEYKKIIHIVFILSEKDISILTVQFIQMIKEKTTSKNNVVIKNEKRTPANRESFTSQS